MLHDLSINLYPNERTFKFYALEKYRHARFFRLWVWLVGNKLCDSIESGHTKDSYTNINNTKFNNSNNNDITFNRYYDALRDTGSSNANDTR